MLSDNQAIPVTTGRDSIMSFMEAFFEAPNDADIEVRMGSVEDAPEEIYLIISVETAGRVASRVAMSATEARTLADIAERTDGAIP